MSKTQPRIEELRALAASARKEGRRFFPKEARAQLMAYAAQRFASGASTRSVAIELGLKPATLSFWRGASKQSAQLKNSIKPVRIVDDATSAGAILVHGVHGIRVEGLSVAQLAELLRCLQ